MWFDSGGAEALADSAVVLGPNLQSYCTALNISQLKRVGIIAMGLTELACGAQATGRWTAEIAAARGDDEADFAGETVAGHAILEIADAQPGDIREALLAAFQKADPRWQPDLAFCLDQYVEGLKETSAPIRTRLQRTLRALPRWMRVN